MSRRLFIIVASLAALLLALPALAEHVGFSDVPAEGTHADSIHWATENGLFEGYDEDTFGPSDPITRAQATSVFRSYYENLDVPGPQGPTGATGPQGPAGDDAFADIVTEKPIADIVPLAPGEQGTATSTCEPGYVAIGGGHKIDGNPGKSFELIRSQPAGSYDGSMFDSWEVTVHNTGAQNIWVQVAIICADINAGS